MRRVHLVVSLGLLIAVHGLLVSSSNQFAVNLYEVLHKEESNLCFSPSSIAWTLSALYQGSRGLTAYELATVLGYDRSQGIDKQLGKAPEWTSLLLQEGFKVLPNYTAILRDVYSTEVRVADLGNPDTVAAINEQVSNVTNGHIQQLFSGPLPPTSRMLLLSATYFKETWQTQFDPSKTYRGLFYNFRGDPVETDLMYTRMRAPVGRHGGFQGLLLRYAGGTHDALVILPQKRFGHRRLSIKLVEQLLASLEEREVDVVLPRFKIESSVPLKSYAADLGMPSAFLESVADLSGITGSRDLYVTEFLHRAAIVVNEEGTEAATVTALTAGLRKRPNVAHFVADYPFVLLVRDAPTGLWLFVAYLSNL
ncbi:intracellular coagulation inhibitor 1-like [Ornithodoros turicata]|uniref:intracellular coagulation inhibitor 1-like n=1 Tax=Ornithodoros turicata TaxID=34597 RepID=UPI0031391E18